MVWHETLMICQKCHLLWRKQQMGAVNTDEFPEKIQTDFDTPPFCNCFFYYSDFWECVDLKVFWNLFLLKYSLNIKENFQTLCTYILLLFAQRWIWTINISVHRHVELPKVYQSCSTLIFSMKSYIFTLMHYVFGNIMCKNFTIN